MKEALNMEQVQAAKTRALDLHLSEIACSPGRYGHYEGLEPCVLCAPGTISGNQFNYTYLYVCNMYVYIYIYVYTCIHICVCMALLTICRGLFIIFWARTDGM